MNRRSSALARLAAGHGAPDALVAALAEANTANQMLAQARAAAFPLADLVAAEARKIACEVAGSEVALEVVVVDREGSVVGQAAGWSAGS